MSLERFHHHPCIQEEDYLEGGPPGVLESFHQGAELGDVKIEVVDVDLATFP